MAFACNIFQFSKATGRIKEAISSLPVASKEDDMEEAAAFKEENKEVEKEISAPICEEEPDPFGLDALISSAPAKEDKSNGKKESLSNSRKEDEERRIFLKLQREALLLCLESAAKRYKSPW